MDKLIGALRSKMMWFSLALVVLGVLQSHMALFQRFFSPDDFGWFTAAVGMAVGVLRWVTTLPLEDR